MREAVIFTIAADATSAERTITAFDRTTNARLRAMTGNRTQAEKDYHAVVRKQAQEQHAQKEKTYALDTAIVRQRKMIAQHEKSGGGLFQSEAFYIKRNNLQKELTRMELTAAMQRSDRARTVRNETARQENIASAQSKRAAHQVQVGLYNARLAHKAEGAAKWEEQKKRDGIEQAGRNNKAARLRRDRAEERTSRPMQGPDLSGDLRETANKESLGADVAYASRRLRVMGRRRMSLEERAERDKEQRIEDYKVRNAAANAFTGGSKSSEHFQQARIQRRLDAQIAAQAASSINASPEDIALARRRLDVGRRWRASRERARAAHMQGPDLDGSMREAAGHGSGWGHGRGGSRNSMFGEIMVGGREALAGRFARLNYTMSVLAQRSGFLGKALTMLATPLGAAAAATVGLGIVTYAYAKSAWNTMRDARTAGFSNTGYQQLLSAGSRAGEGDAVKSGLSSLTGMIGGARSGDEGATKRFMARGIEVAGKTNEEIFAEVKNKIRAESDPSRRQQMGQEFFGSQWPNMQQTILGDGQGNAYTDRELKYLAPGGKPGQGAINLGTSILHAGGKLLAEIGKGYFNLGAATMGQNGDDVLAESESNEALHSQKVWLAKRKKIFLAKKNGTYDERAELKGLGYEGDQMQLSKDEAVMGNQEAQAALDDRDKESLSDLAEKGRKFSGLIHRRNYSMTPRMRTALKIQDLDERATTAWERGDDTGMKKFRDQADAMRKDPKNAWLEFADKTPTQKIQVAVEKSAVSLKAIQTSIDNALNSPAPP